MSQYYLSSVNDLQSMEAISRLMQEGIWSLSNMCTSLFNAHVDPVTDMCSNFQQIRGHIEHADRCLKESERILKGKLTCLDECMVRLTKEQQHVQQEKQEKNLTIETLHRRKKSAEESLNASNAAVKQAERNQEAAEYELEKMEEMKTSGKLVVIAGAVITAVPVVGWFAGPPILFDGIETIVKAEAAIVNAKNEVKECMSQMWKHTINIEDYRSRISKTQNEIKRTNQTLNNVQSNIEWLQQRLVAIAQIQHNFKAAVYHMNVLSGRVNVLEIHTGGCIYWEPVIKIIQDVGNAVITIAHNQLLNGQNVPALINTLSENIRVISQQVCQ
ncbi:uncharacterized protein LOC130557993 [Triplophysa rosa]|uniref:Uncharacterized protein n=1 Tax=Triplophysa rosa TaxID=992332 RepID=A0A9W7WR01_TRIRA|nr:uncharacterized protein LOC130557993 [Triplophysa rosa]XP_057196151.1 uncharacterized protein LOC130557993 [Triplophysa rosa]KAI7806739.1 hypothetical protein IRJ41_011093 [Triplophysa rosa]